jgi:molybdate transport system substrate-binding protein
LALAAGIAGCSGPHTAAPPAKPAQTLTIAGASDLQFAFTEIAELFQKQSGCRVSLSFGSSGQLAQQIEHGLPVDIFAAANVKFIDALQAKGLVVPDSRQLYARGYIVLAVPENSELSITNLNDLSNDAITHIAIANPVHAPYGLAARQALERSGLWEKLQPKIVLGENIRQALQYVETGNAEAGIVALSIAQGAKVSFTPIDESLHDPLDQALAIIYGSHQIELAREFIALLNGPEGKSIMTRFGFRQPNAEHDADASDTTDDSP